MEKAIIGKKVGMTQIFDEAGKVIPVTVIRGGPLHRGAEEDRGKGRLHRRSAGI